MKKTLTLALAALLATPALSQEVVYEVGYSAVFARDDDSVAELNLGALYGSIGYEWTAGRYTNGAEATLFLGVVDDSFGATVVELEPSFELAYRGTWQLASPDFAAFWRLTYTQIEIEASSDAFGLSSTADGWGPGAGVGMEWINFTFGYSHYWGEIEDFNRINIGYRF